MNHSLSSRRPRILKTVAMALVALLGLLLVAAGVASIWIRGRILASVAEVDGEIRVAGLASNVKLQRDAAGVPTVTAANRLDLARATGFLHGQERFFQMDLMRRQAAGELAELFGAAAVGVDRRARVHRFRARAQANLEHLTSSARELLKAYTEGVNSGL